MNTSPTRVPRVGGAGATLAGAAGLLGVKALVSAFVLSVGFTALSDDDFARVVIAQRFVEAPALDPSGTSWLPLPFYVYGASLFAFGSTWAVARATAVALGLASALLVWFAGRALGLERREAWLGAAFAALFPYSALLGVAAVPEAPTAALIVLGAAALHGAPRSRLLGAGALFLACASRYEAWPVAAVFAAFTALDARRAREPRLAAAAALALAFPAAWIAHGVVRHGDAFFFVSRVSAYRAALGGASNGWLDLFRAPTALVTTELELVALAGALVLLRAVSGESTDLGRFSRFGVALGAMVVFLAIGDARGSSPTHHAERALLAAWFGCALVAGFALSRCLEASRSRTIAVALSLVALVAFATRPARAPEAFGQRRAELDVGLAARGLGVDRLAIDAPDFGFFAVQAAFGAPSATWVLDERDPRRERAPDRLAQSPESFRRALLAENVRWLALPRARAALARTIATERAGSAEWVLMELGMQSEPGARQLNP